MVPVKDELAKGKTGDEIVSKCAPLRSINIILNLGMKGDQSML